MEKCHDKAHRLFSVVAESTKNHLSHSNMHFADVLPIKTTNHNTIQNSMQL